MFGRKSRKERLKEEAASKSLIPLSAIAGVYAGAKPILERLLYDDDLRDNIRELVEAIRDITDDVSDEKPADVLMRLWDDDKLRGHIESATGAAQKGSKRIRGEKVKEGGGGKWVFILLAGAAAFLFLSPQTGPEARRLASETISAITSSG
ncbi:MAG: hypothetical protein M3494_00895 [Actinomycetota bacterium]|jgi:hypothetical protein|nr:hypothetical protein [Rubrobacter sp.]MDQ3506567.1 hypothetical protein [Actinomycetota bacterium]